ncbi:SCO family protein [Martelella mediterranea]|jgi:protein SCO1|uniref:Protein SCO1/2 n=2 Tax=Martelella mediterranea TaxID=293089 RepID=A0A4V2V3Y5_9HYPH|nr:SCO family protein [Martelella mediterranea]AQZ54271.1 BsSco [Martelella mediterranea DSM 17316]TCT36029.1 protein SCO1/2 [Martelella mediterranea]
MKRLKTIRLVTWGAVVVVAGFLMMFSGLLPGLERPGTVSTSSSGVAAVGGTFELTTHLGETLTNEELEGKPYLVFFGFTHCPDVCPTTLFELTSLFDDLGPAADKITPLFITVDPERDTPELLASYLTSFDSRIIALRGTKDQTEQAAKAFAAFYEKVPLEGGNYTMDHTAGVYLVNAEGNFMGMLDSHEPRETQMQKLRRLADTAD